MFLMATVTIDRSSVANLWGPGSAVARDLQRRGLAVESKAKTLCPVDTGRLRSSIQTRLDFERGIPVVFIGTNVKYGIFVHEGTRPHWPPPAPLAAWGRRHGFTGRSAGFLIGRGIARRGTRANRFLVDALPAARR